MEAEICRICLEDNNETIFIFSQYLNEYNIVELVFEVASLKFELEDTFPKHICKLCVQKLIDLSLFRRLILDSQSRLAIKTEPQEDNRPKQANEIAFVDVKEEEYAGNTIHPFNAVEVQINSSKNITTPISRLREKKSKRKRPEQPTKSELSTSVNEEAIDQIRLETEGGTSDLAKKIYICDRCDREFPYPSRFIAHYRNAHLKQYKREVCPYCPRAFTITTSCTSNLRRHIRTAHENLVKDEDNIHPTIKCPDCDSIFRGTLEMYDHSKIHDTKSMERDDGYNMSCDDCNIDLETYDNLVSHLQQTHGIANKNDIRPVRCRWCGERCKTIQGLYTHIRFVHKCEGGLPGAVVTLDMINMTPIEKSSSFLCTVCGKALGSQNSYTNHMAIHLGDKPFSCDVCQATFRLKINLKIHKFTHTKERNYHCTECSKSFIQGAHLKTHLKSHGIGIKEKFACTVCNKQFLFRGALKEHMWVHKEGEIKPHVCTFCGKGFVRKHKLNDHVKKEHDKCETMF